MRLLGFDDTDKAIKERRDVNVETLTADKTLTVTDAPIQIYTCSANRIVNLPTGESGSWFFVMNNNTYSSSTYISVKYGATIKSLYGKESVKVYWTGSAWQEEVAENIAFGKSANSNYNSGVGV
ncbi:MAG: hypothetical protein ACPLX7_10440, partial [Candidatus Kapaibacteriota bacterium]